ncbi:MAG TPA: carbohydrate kinase family protein [Spirochaetales bacterium]|nr:carbohydrate kinase family protein [Spirochaetales bacterium]HRY55697.1 carbohydrate kinase family protein [Spirochaetia bacterium]HRZ64425.1 carbohydrate kinase family protein [Spirochaetia bacterium]
MDGIDLVGNLNMDLVIRGFARLPGWGREEIGSDCDLYPSGQAGYTAFALRALGLGVRLAANVGDDDWGGRILGALGAAGVDCAGVERRPGSRTGVTVACVRQDGERAFVSYYGCLMDFDAACLGRAAASLSPEPRVLALCGLNALPNLPLAEVGALFARARRAGGRTALDTGWDPMGWPRTRVAALRGLLREVSVFLPNAEEATALTGLADPAEAARDLAGCGASLVVVKLGPGGSLAFGEGLGPAGARVPAPAARVVDAVGAGDVYNAGFIAGLAEDVDPEGCMALGTAAASLYISRAADRFPSRGEVDLAARAAAKEAP